MNDRLYRSRDDRILAGVAAGVADRLDLDPTLVRILWVVLTPFTGGFALLLYVVMAFVVPEEPDELAFGQWSPGSQRPASWGEPPPPPPPPPVSPGSSTMSSEANPTTASSATEPPPASAAGASTSTATSASPDAATAAAGGSIPGWVPPSSTDWRSSREAERDRRRAEKWARRAERRARGDRTGGLIFGVLLILLGAFFLGRTYLPDVDWDRLWPIGIIALGVLLLASSVRRTPSGPGPGP